MRRKIVARLLQSFVVVLIAATISFFLIHSAPGDPFALEGSRMSAEVRDYWRGVYGLDQPLIVQYGRFIGAVLRGKLGYSISNNADVASVIAKTLPRTLFLALFGLTLSLGIGMCVGVMQAARHRRWFDRLATAVLVFFYSLPDFWAALMILLTFTFWWRLLPTGGMVDPMHDYMAGWPAFVDRVRHAILPVASLTLLSLASVARYQRAAMLEILPSDYMRTARAKGASERTVLWRHGLRAALTPMITIFGLMLPGFLGGAVFIEKVFGWPGMGSLVAAAIEARDYSLVTASVIVGSVIVVIGNLLADLLQMALDPRVRE